MNTPLFLWLVFRAIKKKIAPKRIFTETLFRGLVFMYEKLGVVQKQHWPLVDPIVILGYNYDTKRKMTSCIMEIVNLTPHDVVIWEGGRVTKTIPVSGEVARIGEAIEKTGEIDINGSTIPSGVKWLTGEVTGYNPEPGKLYYVSLPFAMGMLALGRPVDQLRIALEYHRNNDGVIDGVESIGTIQGSTAGAA